MVKPKGWRNESARHSLASRGIKSAQRIPNKPNQRKRLIDAFNKDIDVKHLGIEYEYTTSDDGVIKKFQGKKDSVQSLSLLEMFKANNLITIHNHPDEFPPSRADIFIFLFVQEKESIVELPSGKKYIMKRNPRTEPIQIRLDTTMVEEYQRTKEEFNQEYEREFDELMRTRPICFSREDKKAGLEFLLQISEDTLFVMAKRYNFQVKVIQ